MQIAILGVGRMGSRLLAAWTADGFGVTGYDVGEYPASAPDILVTVLPGSREIAGIEASIAALPEGSLWLDLTSSDPSLIESIVDRTGVVAVGAPMGGGPSAADARALRFYAGGAPAALERVRPLLEAVGSVEHVGEGVASGYTAKLIANLLWFGQVVAVTESLLLGQALGLAPAELARTLRGSAGGSVFIDEYLDSLLAGDYLESFGLDRIVEELDILVALADRHDVPFELSALVARTHRDALARFGAVNGELLAAKLLEQRAHRDLRA